ncbi:MAG TPA: hypothetical protein VFW31_02095 [Candidatus Angelobacter sp.]|nr:hypothetical protein [Candidatus Angelobacter sp.]
MPAAPSDKTYENTCTQSSAVLPVGGYHVNGYLAACLRVVATNPNDGPIGHYGGQECEE